MNSLFSSYLLSCIWLISFLLFPCASVWKNTRAWVTFPIGILNDSCYFARRNRLCCGRSFACQRLYYNNNWKPKLAVFSPSSDCCFPLDGCCTGATQLKQRNLHLLFPSWRLLHRSNTTEAAQLAFIVSLVAAVAPEQHNWSSATSNIVPRTVTSNNLAISWCSTYLYNICV